MRYFRLIQISFAPECGRQSACRVSRSSCGRAVRSPPVNHQPPLARPGPAPPEATAPGAASGASFWAELGGPPPALQAGQTQLPAPGRGSAASSCRGPAADRRLPADHVQQPKARPILPVHGAQPAALAGAQQQQKFPVLLPAPSGQLCPHKVLCRLYPGQCGGSVLPAGSPAGDLCPHLGVGIALGAKVEHLFGPGARLPAGLPSGPRRQHLRTPAADGGVPAPAPRRRQGSCPLLRTSQPQSSRADCGGPCPARRHFRSAVRSAFPRPGCGIGRSHTTPAGKQTPPAVPPAPMPRTAGAHSGPVRFVHSSSSSPPRSAGDRIILRERRRSGPPARLHRGSRRRPAALWRQAPCPAPAAGPAPVLPAQRGHG